MRTSSVSNFNKNYQTHLKHLHIKGLHKPWVDVGLVKPPKVQRLPDIVTVNEAQLLFQVTKRLSYRILYFVLYSLGLRLNAQRH